MKAFALIQDGIMFAMPHVTGTVVDIPDDNHLKGFYETIGCDCVDLVCVEIDGIEYDVFCDDEALLKYNPIPTLHVNDDVVIFGSLVFTKGNDDGETVALDDDDIKRIVKYVKTRKEPMIQFIKEVVARKRGA